MSNKLLVIIAGPTGVGKTEVAIQLAQKYRSVIISADSRQVYKELAIGVGRPSPDQLAAVKHHFVGHLTIHEPYTASRYAKEVHSALDRLFADHDVVFLAGGTGLYIKAVIEGFDDIPEVPASVFQTWLDLWKKEGTEHLWKKLNGLDPDYAKKVDASNHTRLIRALSVIDATGKTFSSFLKGKKVPLSFKVLPIALELPREELYAKIDRRVGQMIEDGWLEEAKTLYPQRQLQALQTVGYKELFSYFDGNLSIAEAIHAIQQATRRYAKRQRTWWRNQGNWITIHPTDIDHIKNLIDQKLDSNHS